MTVEATAAEPVVDPALETPAADAGAPAAAEGDTAPAGEAEVVQLPANQLQQFIDNQAQMRAQLEQAQRETEQLRLAQASQVTDDAETERQRVEAEALANTIAAKEGEYSEALIAGDKEKAAAVYLELNTARGVQTRHMIKAELEAQSVTLTAQTAQQIAESKFKSNIATLTSTHPELDSTNDKYDAVLTSQINSLTDVYIKAGTPADEALTQAVQLYQHKLESVSPTAAATVDLGRKTLKEKLGDASRQPGTPAGKGSEPAGGDPVVDLSTLSDTDFAKLSPDVLKSMRGDTVG